jgi:hypothetical protein
VSLWRRDCVLNGCLHLAPLCQILLASSRGENAYRIAHQLGCNPQTARNAIHAFNDKGLPEALQPGSKHPHTVHRAFDPEQAEALREMFHRSAREFGRDSSLWTLEMAPARVRRANGASRSLKVAFKRSM